MIRPVATAVAPASTLAVDVRDGLGRLGQKTLPSKYLYDEVGSALFEAISVLPEYGLTRADERILTRHAESIVDSVAAPMAVAELGSGTGRKTRSILEAAARRHPLVYSPIDISRSALGRCVAELGQVSGVTIGPLEAEYLDGLERAARRRGPGERLLVLFLGSTIGNFDPPAAARFLRGVRETLRAGDALLLGTDLAEPADRFAAAYDDPAGVTAAFDLNLLARINRDLGADFNLERFVHEARWNPDARRVEMHLRSLGRQRVRVPGAEITVAFAPDETIWTESSYKYRLDEPGAMGARAGFRSVNQWLDEEWPFAETLLEVE
jgi:dimethylhistidine N-methyltransferase